MRKWLVRQIAESLEEEEADQIFEFMVSQKPVCDLKRMLTRIQQEIVSKEAAV